MLSSQNAQFLQNHAQICSTIKAIQNPVSSKAGCFSTGMLPSVLISSSVIEPRDTVLVIIPNITFGVPRGVVTWLKNGQVLEANNPRVNITDGGALIVTDIDTGDEGIYTVMVANIHGIANANVQVVCELSLIGIRN
jgi:hypothetical protein